MPRDLDSLHVNSRRADWGEQAALTLNAKGQASRLAKDDPSEQVEFPYEVNGNEITTRAYVAKDPNYMGDWPDNAGTLPFHIEGDVMHLEWNVFKFTLRKVEGERVDAAVLILCWFAT